MKITVCASMSFAKEMLELKKQIEILYPTYQVELPGGVQICVEHVGKNMDCPSEQAGAKMAHDWIKKHWQLISESDAILVANYTKKGKENYIGANSFMEMGFAHVLNKPIFILFGKPDLPFYEAEIDAMQPTLMNGDLTQLVK